MIGPNLSEWALLKRSLVVFLMILAVIAGASSFTSLGRGEDPAFTFRTMVVAAAWPGATVDETMQQVTERLERTLQETDYLDRVRSYTIAGQTTIFVDLKQSTPPAQGAGHLVPGAQEHRRHARHAAAGRGRAVLQRRLRQHVRHHLCLHRRRLQLPRAARPRRSGPLAAAARAGRLEDRGARRAGRADLHRVLDRTPGRTAPRHGRGPRHAAGAERRAPGRARSRATGNASSCASRGVRFRGRHRGGQHRRRRPHLPAGRHRHRAPRLRRSAAAHVPCQWPARHRSRHRHAGRRRHPRAGRKRAQRDGRHHGQPAGRHRADAGGRPGRHRGHRDQRLPDLALAGDRDHPRLQLRQPRRCGPAPWSRWRSR